MFMVSFNKKAAKAKAWREKYYASLRIQVLILRFLARIRYRRLVYQMSRRIQAGWRMHVDEQEALIAAQQAIGFPVGHASAQQVWRGFRSRPTWRVLCYSADEPPTRRGLVLVDAVDGTVVQHLTEDNPESWAGATSQKD